MTHDLTFVRTNLNNISGAVYELKICIGHLYRVYGPCTNQQLHVSSFNHLLKQSKIFSRQHSSAIFNINQELCSLDSTEVFLYKPRATFSSICKYNVNKELSSVDSKAAIQTKSYLQQINSKQTKSYLQ